jgi:hypothetical protein
MEKSNKINNEVWRIILKHLGLLDFNEQEDEKDIFALLDDI